MCLLFCAFIASMPTLCVETGSDSNPENIVSCHTHGASEIHFGAILSHNSGISLM